MGAIARTSQSARHRQAGMSMNSLVELSIAVSLSDRCLLDLRRNSRPSESASTKSKAPLLARRYLRLVFLRDLWRTSATIPAVAYRSWSLVIPASWKLSVSGRMLRMNLYFVKERIKCQAINTDVGVPWSSNNMMY